VDLIDDVLGVDAVLETLPVDRGLLFRFLFDVVEVKNRCKLAVGFTSIRSGGGLLESAQPVDRKMVGLIRLGNNLRRNSRCMTTMASALKRCCHQRLAKLLSDLRHSCI